MDPGMLPFGQTTTTSDELRKLVDIERVVEELSAQEVKASREACTEFLDATVGLVGWLASHGREYAWRFSTDPWQIYATEILLQRTRANAVAEIYAEFFQTFPDAPAVLDQDESVIRETVHSLGFVNHRVRTLQEAASLIADHGTVPSDPEELQRPWRVGPYTARATVLFAFDQPLALVDTNTARIVSRVFAYPLPSQPHKSDQVYHLLDALVPDDPALARAFNLALLDLGALRCTPADPDCARCPLQSTCRYAKCQHQTG